MKEKLEQIKAEAIRQINESDALTDSMMYVLISLVKRVN